MLPSLRVDLAPLRAWIIIASDLYKNNGAPGYEAGHVVRGLYRLYRYVTRTNVSFFDPTPNIKERNIRAPNITI